MEEVAAILRSPTQNRLTTVSFHKVFTRRPLKEAARRTIVNAGLLCAFNCSFSLS